VGIARALDVTERFRIALSLFSAFIFHFRMRKNENSNVRRAFSQRAIEHFARKGSQGSFS
jgi:hypothetical protein